MDIVGRLNHDDLIYHIFCFYSILELNFHPFFIETFTKTQNTNFENILLGKRFLSMSWLVVLRLNVPVNNFSVMSGRSQYE